MLTVDAAHIALQAHIDQLCAEWVDRLDLAEEQCAEWRAELAGGVPDGGRPRVQPVQVRSCVHLAHRAVEILREQIGHQRDRVREFMQVRVLGHRLPPMVRDAAGVRPGSDLSVDQFKSGRA